MKHRSSVINHEQKWHDVEIKPGHFLQGRTNAELASTTKDLRDEKARMDTLLVRQYNLIQCFSNPKATGNESPKNNSDSSAMGQLYWILSLILFNEHHHLWVWNNSVTQSDAPSGMQAESRPCAVRPPHPHTPTHAGRIETMRSQLNSDNVKNLAETEQIQTLEVYMEYPLVHITM
jgi:hypothetical protein